MNFFSKIACLLGKYHNLYLSEIVINYNNSKFKNMKKKLLYEVPDAELIELKLEQTIATSPGDPDLEGDENLGDI